jgi:excisionase family DNA binding protein
MQLDGLITVEDAAQRLDLHHSTIRRAIKRGDLPAVRVCRRIRIDPDELLRWVESQRVKAA